MSDINKRFISQDALDEQRAAQQREWARAYEAGERRTPPPPDDSYDPRTLYERLQEQRQAKLDALAESKKFSNMVHRLDQDEYEFLAALEDKGRQEELLKQREEELALAAYREAVSSLRESKPAAPRSAEPDSSNAGPKQKGESQRAQKRPLVLDRLGSLVRVPKKARDAAETNSKSRPSPQQGPDEGGGADKPRVDKPRDTEPGKSALASLLGAYGDSEEGEEGNESGAEL